MFTAKIKTAAACLTIIAAVLLLGLYCTQLNRIFYLRHGPFWDSVSYDDLLARIMLSVRAGDPIKGFALIYASTVALPWLEAMVLAPGIEPSRAVGVWIQVSWIVIAALAGYVYFRRVAKFERVTSVCCALLFFVVRVTFYWSGGLSDFRFDYLQYTLFGLSCMLYLIARADGRFDLWVLWGVALGLACLARATTPVFAALVFGPFFLVDLWRERADFGAYLCRYGGGAVACLLVCGWFFIGNFSRLYFYYVVWNWNANAKLPLGVAIGFADIVYQDIGPVATIACLALGGVTIASAVIGGERRRWNWRGLWCGVAPLAYLIGSGAELYGAVCEIAMFGFILFALAPMTLPALRSGRRLHAVAAVIALAATAASGVYNGFDYHTDETGGYIQAAITPLRANIERVTRCIADDMAASPPGAMTYTVLYTGALNSEVVTNTLLFDAHLPADVLPNGLLALHVGAATLSMSPFRVDRMVTPAQWDMVEGADDAQKIDAVARDVVTEADYVIAPSSAGTALRGGTINGYAAAIADKIAALAPLRLLCRDLEIGVGEFATIYRNPTHRHES